MAYGPGVVSMEKYYDVNKKRWNELVDIHAKSDDYDLDGFIAGANSLHSIELDALGDVSGKSLLHLQCHFGLDTLSWGRLGARATGVDFSETAIELARNLAVRVGADAEFINCNVYDLPEHLDSEFDIVFTSYGALCWLHDIEAWAGIVSRYLKPGGTFFMAEFHPFMWVFDDEFPSDLKVNALIGAGLTFRGIGEYPFSVDGTQFAFMEPGEDGYSRLPGYDLPLMYSIKATK